MLHVHKGILFTYVTSPYLYTQKAQSTSCGGGGIERTQELEDRGKRCDTLCAEGTWPLQSQAHSSCVDLNQS